MPDNTCVCCGTIIPEGRHICLLCEGENEVQHFHQQIPPVRTNGDKIRAMSNDELVELLIGSYPCDCQHGCPNDCENCIREWLESEARNE